MNSIARQCLLHTGTGVGRIYKGGKEEYDWDGGRVLRRIREGVDRFPALALDSEGGDKVYYQVGWVGEDCLEAAIFGRYFFPEEVKELLRLPHVYIIGRSVHSDIGCLLGKATGHGGLDLSVLTLDLPDASENTRPMRSGLGTLATEATAVSFEHIKNSRKTPEGKPFIGVRDGNWNKEHIGPFKTVYAALDVTLPFTILFRFLVHHAAIYKTIGRKNKVVPSWPSVLFASVGSLVDRVLNDRKMTVGRMNTPRDLSQHTSALALSDALEY